MKTKGTRSHYNSSHDPLHDNLHNDHDWGGINCLGGDLDD